LNRIDRKNIKLIQRRAAAGDSSGGGIRIVEKNESDEEDVE
jgi:hypothetical protein